MADFTTTDLKTAQVRLINRFQANELRFRRPATYLNFLQNQNFFVPDNSVRTREDRAVEANFRASDPPALGTERLFNHTGPVGDSSLLTLSWVTRTSEFQTSLKRMDNNFFTQADEFDTGVDNCIKAFMNGFETLAINHLFNNRNTVDFDQGSNEGTFDVVEDTFEITNSTNGERAVQITKSILDLNAYSPSYTFYCDETSFNRFEKDLQQGNSNSTNLSFQNEGITFVRSPELGPLFGALVSAYSLGAWIAIQDGSVGVNTWIPRQNREGRVTPEDVYSTMINPVDGLSYALHTYVERFDGTATNSVKQDTKTEWELSLDLAFHDTPLTVAGETSLLAFALV
ncbi:hypothetical protein LCGC14_0370760 [marine sediment metagenome]|uniref:Uncharacterized protein n=2 Tax=root TaxID=1 RepID=A0A0F9T5B1_9ZZZZ